MSDLRNPWDRLRNCAYVIFMDGRHSKTLGKDAADEIARLTVLLAIQDDKVRNLTRELAEARRERDAAFAMSKCECGEDGACRSLVQARDKALEEAAKVADEEADQSRALMFDLRTIKDYRSAKQLEREAETLLRVAASLRALKEKP